MDYRDPIALDAQAPGQRVQQHVEASRSWQLDLGLYGFSALYAGLTWILADIPIQVEWGRLAFWPYAMATVVVLVIRSRRARLTYRIRVGFVVALMIGTTGIPLYAAVTRSGPHGDSARSEVLIVEEGASALVRGLNPYMEEYLDGPLASRPIGTKTHFPYPPAMLAFGVPHALIEPSPLADARIWFFGVSSVVAVFSLLLLSITPERRILLFEALFVLPSGALLLTTGGHDVPVLALLLLGIALIDNAQAVSAGVAAGMAMALRQSSLLVVPLLAGALSGPDRRRFSLAASLTFLSTIAPFAIWNPGALFEDAVLFPLGLGEARSSALTPTLGSLLLDAFPASRGAITVVLLALVTSIGAALLLYCSRRTLASASLRAAVLFFAAIVLAPVARFGYLVYPAQLLLWGLVLRRSS